MSQLIPDLNTRPQTLLDFYILAERLGIPADEFPMRSLHGCTFPDDDGERTIRINSLVSEPERIIAGFHEIVHNILHATEGEIYASMGPLWNHRKDEHEAEMIGVLALLPLSEIAGMTPEEIAGVYRLPLKTAKFRMQVFERYKM